jgi:DNA mismatch endonuclease (patch repair protein)
MDKLSPARRSSNMRAIRSKDTKPELAVRTALRGEGLTGYRLHRKDLPGRPDIAFIGHDCREGVRQPRSKQDYWLPKIAGNRTRDERHVAALAALGWDVLVLWDCEINDGQLSQRLRSFMRAEPGPRN